MEIKQYCRYKGIMCSLATEFGYCKVTACINREVRRMTREEAIPILRQIAGSYGDVKKYYDAMYMAIEAIKDQKTGKWIGNEFGECSVCGHKGCASDIWDRCKKYYCPNCGARMESEEE